MAKQEPIGAYCSIFRYRPCNECQLGKIVAVIETLCPACGKHYTMHNDFACQLHYEFKRATFGWVKRS
jgi:hypothetical protein